MKIGLIAMSGTRIRDPLLLDMLKDAAGPLARLAAVASLPSLGLLTVAAVIGDNAEVQYLQCANVADWTPPPDKFDLVAISTFSAQINEAYELAEKYKQSGTPVVIGGTHASVMPEEVIERGYIACIGEAELVWDDIIRDAKANCLKSKYGELGKVCDITQSPIPAFHLLAPDKYNRIPIQASRGCPHRCEFCAASILISPRYRQKTVAQVMREIDAALKIWKRPFIEFVDDNALVDRNYWKSLLPELRTRKVRWFAECDISIGDDDELLRLMHDSGCREVLIGLESPTQSALDGVELNNNWKSRTQSTYKRSLNNIQSHGIRVIGCFIFGLDRQTAETASAIYEFLRETELFDVQLTLQTAFPGTPLYARLKENGRLKAADDYQNCTLFDLNIVPENTNEAELVDSYRALLKKLHANGEHAWRKQQFIQRIKATTSGKLKASR